MSGATLLISTHIIDSVDMLWDRTIILQEGCVKADVTRETMEDGEDFVLFRDPGEGTAKRRREQPEYVLGLGDYRVYRNGSCRGLRRTVGLPDSVMTACGNTLWTLDYYQH